MAVLLGREARPLETFQCAGMDHVFRRDRPLLPPVPFSFEIRVFRPVSAGYEAARVYCVCESCEVGKKSWMHWLSTEDARCDCSG